MTLRHRLLANLSKKKNLFLSFEFISFLFVAFSIFPSEILPLVITRFLELSKGKKNNRLSLVYR